MSIIERALRRTRETRLFAGSSRIPSVDAYNLADAGVRVDEENAQSLTAVWASIRLIADTIASLPVGVYERVDDVRQPVDSPTWLTQPDLSDPNSTNYQHWQSVLTSLLLAGNSYTYVVRDGNGEVLEVHVLDPRNVRPERVKTDDGYKILFRVRADHTELVFDSNDVIHIPLFKRAGHTVGVSPIEACRLSIGSALAAETYGAKWFRNSGVPSGVIEVPSELTQEQATQLIEAWKRTHSGMNAANLPGLLTGGAKFTPISLKPSDVAWLDARRFGVAEIARIFRVPPFMIGVSEAGSVSYASTEQAAIYFVQHTIRPYLEQIESSYQRILPRSADGNATFLRFNVDGILRGDVSSRYTAYATGIQHGFLRVSDVRALEDLSPLDDTSLESLRPLSLAPAAVADTKTKVETLGSLIRAGFDPADALRAVGLDDIRHLGSLPVTVQGDK